VRTLICEFQPFHNMSINQMVEVDLEDVHRSLGGSYRSGVVRVPIRKGTSSGNRDKHYHYAYVGDKNVKRGDWALVHNGNEFGIVEVKRVIPGIDPKVTKHVIEVLLVEEFKAYLERNKKVDELRSMQDELDFRLEQDKKLDKYKDLATRDPRAKTLLDQLQSFFGIDENVQIDATPAK
jgi:hypothetical protein